MALEKTASFKIRWYTLLVFLMAILALLDSVYLSISHFKVYTDMGYQSFCAISKAVNCDTVSQSKYAIFLNVPVPVWGVFGYCVLISLICMGFSKKSGYGLWFFIFILSLVFSLYSVILALISNYVIESYCLFCIVSYIANFFICFMSFIILRRFYPIGIISKFKNDVEVVRKNKKTAICFSCLLFVIACLLPAFFPDYWNYKTPINSVVVERGVTPGGNPWIGSKNPELTIIEYSDYLCFQCRKMHFFLRNLAREYPDKIRIVHKNFPMDHRINPLVTEPFHDGAAVMAVIAKYAVKKDQFWEVNDYFYIHGREKKYIDLEDISQGTELSVEGLKDALRDKELVQSVLQEIREGIDLNIKVTPTYVIDGKVYPGGIPPEILKEILM